MWDSRVPPILNKNHTRQLLLLQKGTSLPLVRKHTRLERFFQNRICPNRPEELVNTRGRPVHLWYFFYLSEDFPSLRQWDLDCSWLWDKAPMYLVGLQHWTYHGHVGILWWECRGWVQHVSILDNWIYCPKVLNRPIGSVMVWKRMALLGLCI